MAKRPTQGARASGLFSRRAVNWLFFIVAATVSLGAVLGTILAKELRAMPIRTEKHRITELPRDAAGNVVPIKLEPPGSRPVRKWEPLSPEERVALPLDDGTSAQEAEQEEQ